MRSKGSKTAPVADELSTTMAVTVNMSHSVVLSRLGRSMEVSFFKHVKHHLRFTQDIFHGVRTARLFNLNFVLGKRKGSQEAKYGE